MLFSSSALIWLLASSAVRAAPNPSCTPGSVSAAWYTGWHATEGFPLSAVPWSKYTHLTYAFAETTPDIHNVSLAGSDPDLLPQFVSTAHDNNVKAIISIGGWTGSRYFSTAFGSASNRSAFVKTVTNLTTKYNLDGIDFDWEYPNHQGIGCNTINANDTVNFLQFLKELRNHPVGAKLILTAATSIVPYIDATNQPSKDVSGFAKYLDWISIMDYDIWGPWSDTVGPNSPLNDTCAAPANQQGSAVSAVAAWNGAGMPLDQIVLGVASYGHSFSVPASKAFASGSTTTLAAYPSFNKTNQPQGGIWDSPPGTDVCGNQAGWGGIFDFFGLIDAGFLTASGTAAAGIDYRFDGCSQTAYVYNKTSEVMVSFDDARAMAAKGSFIKSQKLRGFSTWEAGGDSNRTSILLNAIRSTMLA